MTEFNDSYNMYYAGVKDMESNICSMFSKISGINADMFKQSNVISPSGDIDKNALKDVMLKNEDGLTDEDKSILNCLEKILGDEEYNNYKAALLKNPEDLSDDEKKMLDRVNNVFDYDLSLTNRDEVMKEIKLAKTQMSDIMLKGEKGLSDISNEVMDKLNASLGVDKVKKIMDIMIKNPEDLTDEEKQMLAEMEKSKISADGVNLSNKDVKYEKLSYDINADEDDVLSPMVMGTTITADGFDFSFPAIDDVPANPSIVTPWGLAATIFTAILAHTDSVGQTPEEEEAAIEEYNRRTITEMAKGIPNKWPWSALPNTGSYPFVPPTDKAGNPICKKDRDSGGIIDQDGNVWTRDKQAERVGNGHWDVKLKNGDHLNVNGNDVDNSGEINHGKGKES